MSLPEAGGALLHAGPERLVPSVPGEEARQPAGDGVCAESLQTGPPGPLGISQGAPRTAGEKPARPHTAPTQEQGSWGPLTFRGVQ